MVDKKLADYVKANLAKGYSLEDVRKSAYEYGWSQTDIDGAILEASGSGPQASLQTGSRGMGGPEKGKKKGHKRVIIGLIVLFILILVLLFVIAETMEYFNDLYPSMLLPA